MTKVGMYMGTEVFRDRDGMYYLRVPVRGVGGFDTVHDLHRRVPVGKFSNFTEMTRVMRHRKGVIGCR